MNTRCFLICSALFLTTGCGPDVAPHPETAPASGVVTYLGKPVEQAIIVFNPTSHKYAASTVTDKDGKYDLQAFPPAYGAVPGSYTVTILKASQEDIFQERDGKAALGKAESLIPARYSNPGLSGLKAELTMEGNTSLNFELKK